MRLNTAYADGWFELFAFPRGLKPGPAGIASGAAEAAPFPGGDGDAEASSFLEASK
jgi:hypothetical protein